MTNENNVNAAVEGGMGREGYSSRSYERGQLMNLSDVFDINQLMLGLSNLTNPAWRLEQLREFDEGIIEEPPVRRLQLKTLANFRIEGNQSQIDGYDLEASIPLGDVIPSLAESDLYFLFYGNNFQDTTNLRVEEYQPNLNRRLDLESEILRSHGESSLRQAQIIESVSGPNRRFSISNQISEDQFTNAATLWQDSFEWKQDEVRDLIQQANTPDSGVYISAVCNGENDLISLSFAQAQEITFIHDGAEQNLVVFELTDLITHPQKRERGAGAACVSYLMSQISHDYEQPIFIAECNALAGSHRLLARLGFETNLAPDGGVRLLTDHVAVGDNQTFFNREELKVLISEVGETLSIAINNILNQELELRDFIMMYLPHEQLAHLRTNFFPYLEG